MLDVDLPAFYAAHVCHLKNSFKKDTLDPSLYTMKAPVFLAIPSRLHTTPSLLEEQKLSHRMLIVLLKM